MNRTRKTKLLYITDQVRAFPMRKLTMSLLGMAVVLFFSYLFLVGHTISLVSERKAFQGEMRTLSGEIADLEIAYYTASNTVDIDLAYELGFQEVDTIFYAYETPTSVARN